MTDEAIKPDDLGALISAHGGLEGLARELGQCGNFIADEGDAKENEPPERVGPRWWWLLNRLRS